jgi:hypothetical protein
MVPHVVQNGDDRTQNHVLSTDDALKSEDALHAGFVTVKVAFEGQPAALRR